MYTIIIYHEVNISRVHFNAMFKLVIIISSSTIKILQEIYNDNRNICRRVYQPSINVPRKTKIFIML